MSYDLKISHGSGNVVISPVMLKAIPVTVKEGDGSKVISVTYTKVIEQALRGYQDDD